MNRKVLLALVTLTLSQWGWTICNPSNAIEALSKVSWDCMFPMTIAGLVTMGGEEQQSPTGQRTPICSCLQYGSGAVGIPISFWEPKAFIDVVQDAWCFPGLGIEMEGLESPFMNDGSRTSNTHYTFAHSHYVLFPVLALLDMFYDLPCLNYSEGSEADIAMISEVLPTWNNDLLSGLVYPETVLFANPAAQLACMADAVTANFNRPVNALFWCLGSWGTVYPLTGTISGSDQMEAHAAIAARTIYQMLKLGLMKEYQEDGCGQRYVTMWTKDRYKLQLMLPTSYQKCFAFGGSSLTWGAGLNTLDNHSYFLFRKVDCCDF